MRLWQSAPPASSVLFVCLGNICRSPTAEGVFRKVAARAGVADQLRIDSAGTSDWCAGSPPDRRAMLAARRRGYELASLRARQIEGADFERFGWILAMDESNLQFLQALRPSGCHGHIGLLLDLAPVVALREVPDPYYGGPEGFELVLDLIEVAARALLTRMFPELPPAI